jgi:signal transduction histidine kinase
MKEMNDDISDVNKIYKAYFIGINDSQKKEFKDSKCIMIISVGQKYHENGELKAAISLVNKHFAYCNILVCDTLQRHSIKIENQDKNEQELYALSKKNGDDWIERNQPYIDNFDIPHTTSRWDDWISQNNYKGYINQVYALYNNDDSYKKIVNEIAEEFLARKSRQDLTEAQKKIAFDSSIQFLLEESAVACLWVESGYKFDVYPTRSNMAMIVAYTKLVNEKFGYNSNSLRLNIKKFSNNSQETSVNRFQTEEFKNIATNYILTHAPGHIYWKNLDGVFLGCNVEHANYFGFDRPIDIIGKTNHDFLDEETAHYISEIDRTVINTGTEHFIEECVNGTQYFLSKKTPLRDYNNNVIGLLGTSINITPQKELERNLENTVQELQRTLEAKESFIKNMNHEIRIPMQLILNGAKILKENFYTFGNDDKLRFLDGMIEATNRLDNLVNNLLDMSKFKDGKFILNFNTEDLQTLIEEIIQEFTLIYKNKITHDIQAEITKTMCDKIRIQQVLRNLLMNSIKYSNNFAPIHIHLSNYKKDNIQYIKCTLEDQGIGISQEDRERIFEPFTTSTRTIAIPGVGLGLTISKEIIESHNGAIWAEENIQTGARISFIIPVL